MAKSTKNNIKSARSLKKYHTLKLVEGLMNDNTKLAEKHLRKLIETRLGNKIKHVLENDNLI